MGNKTCGECRFYHPIFKHEGSCTATSDLRKTCDFTQGCTLGGCYPKPPTTNGDKIMQGGSRALAEFHGKLACDVCAYRYDHRCPAPKGKQLSCVDGIEAWLNAPAESEGKDE